MTTMTLATAAGCLRECIQEDVPAMLWGPPGVGKSEVVKQVAHQMDIAKYGPVAANLRRNLRNWNPRNQFGLIDFRATLRDPVDLRGLPLVDAKSGTTRWLAPDELPQVDRDGEEGILFLDELPNAAQSMQAACFGLVLDRQIGEYRLPKGWVPVAAGNRMSDRAAAQRMPTALRNRFAHFEVEADLAAWADWALANGVAPEVVAFVKFRPALLHVMPKGEENAFPTPRAWAKVAKMVDKPNVVRQHIVASLVGDGPSAEFEGFLRVFRHLPDIQQILADPMKAKLPPSNEPAAIWATCGAIAKLATRANFANVLKYASRLPNEFAVMTGLDAVKRDPSLKTAPGYAQWAVSVQGVTA